MAKAKQEKLTYQQMCEGVSMMEHAVEGLRRQFFDPERAWTDQDAMLAASTLHRRTTLLKSQAAAIEPPHVTAQKIRRAREEARLAAISTGAGRKVARVSAYFPEEHYARERGGAPFIVWGEGRGGNLQAALVRAIRSVIQNPQLKGKSPRHIYLSVGLDDAPPLEFWQEFQATRNELQHYQEREQQQMEERRAKAAAKAT